MITLLQLAILFSYSLLGDLLSQLIPIPIPGSIIGLILLFLSLQFNLIQLKNIEQTGTLLKKHLAMFFVPLAVGIIDHLDILKANSLSFLLIILISTILTYIITAKTSDRFLKDGK